MYMHNRLAVTEDHISVRIQLLAQESIPIVLKPIDWLSAVQVDSWSIPRSRLAFLAPGGRVAHCRRRLPWLALHLAPAV